MKMINEVVKKVAGKSIRAYEVDGCRGVRIEICVKKENETATIFSEKVTSRAMMDAKIAALELRAGEHGGERAGWTVKYCI